MYTAPEPLVLDLLEWVAEEPRLYSEVLDAWRTSCPRLTVWEDAVDRGLVQRDRDPNGGLSPRVIVTDRGRELLAASGRPLQAMRPA
ncbi:MAG TPA: hypothetical protein VE549_06940 [Myxococcaceae bacterium]|nr:hypothetical protein [Myxococcaceae bacterium]